jgi:hypothetical protein
MEVFSFEHFLSYNLDASSLHCGLPTHHSPGATVTPAPIAVRKKGAEPNGTYLSFATGGKSNGIVELTPCVEFSGAMHPL